MSHSVYLAFNYRVELKCVTFPVEKDFFQTTERFVALRGNKNLF